MIYTNTTVEISTAAADFDQRTPLDDTDVTAVTVTVTGPAGDVLAAAAMDWDPARRRFVTRWDTPNVAGDYLARVTWQGVDASISVGLDRFHVHPLPAP